MSFDSPNFEYEAALIKKGVSVVAGVDEVGRGPLAGPVVAAAVILDPGRIPLGMNDSKKLTEKRRELLFIEIMTTACVSVHIASALTIDAMNIREASLHSMVRAIEGLSTKPNHTLIDGRDVPKGLKAQATAIIKGDAKSLSIAAASIVAKVTRDRLMIAADSHFPAYGLKSHKGYGAKAHRDTILELGPTPLHRRSFNPLKTLIEDGKY